LQVTEPTLDFEFLFQFARDFVSPGSPFGLDEVGEWAGRLFPENLGDGLLDGRERVSATLRHFGKELPPVVVGVAVVE